MTTDHTNDDPPTSLYEFAMQGGKLDAPASETPEAPPAREPGWYWVKWYAEQVDWTATMADGDGVKDPNIGKWKPLSAVHEWGPRIDPPDAKPPELPPLPDVEGWTFSGDNRHAVGTDDREVSRSNSNKSVIVWVDGVGKHFPNEVFQRLLGLTAPAADVRALCEAQLGRGYGTHVEQFARSILDALTGKGAPL